MIVPPTPRRPRRIYPPETARRIRTENMVAAVGVLAFWALMGAILGRMLRLW